jgi:hypothetical protein
MDFHTNLLLRFYLLRYYLLHLLLPIKAYGEAHVFVRGGPCKNHSPVRGGPLFLYGEAHFQNLNFL